MKPHLVFLLPGCCLLAALAACPRATTGGRTDQRVATTPPRAELVVGGLAFAGPAGPRTDASFMPGEVVTCLLSVSGFQHERGRVNLRADLRVTGPQGQVVLDQPDLELLSGATASRRPGAVRSAAELRISRAAPPGRQVLAIRVRDLVGGGSGSARGEFTLLGTPVEPEGRLRVHELRWAGGSETPPGGVLPAVFVLTGFSTRKLAARGHHLDLAVHSLLKDASGRTISEHREPLFRGELSFAPDAYPFEHQISIPAQASPGDYRALLELEDKISGSQVRQELSLRVVPPRLGIWSIHLRDASGLARESFLLGEQTFVRFAVFGLGQRGGQLDAAVDLAIAGPDGGVYLARPKAVTARGAASRAFVKAGRLPAQLPLLLPALAPTGSYRLVLRARDHLARKEVVAEHRFTLRGSAPPPLDRFTVTALEVRERADLPPTQGDTFVAGRSYELDLMLGGIRPRERRKLTYAIAVEAGLRLRSPAGAVVHERKRLFALRRELSYKPLRLPVQATWRVPPELAPGLYDLEVDAVDQLSDQASQLRRRVEVVRPR